MSTKLNLTKKLGYQISNYTNKLLAYKPQITVKKTETF